jgi:hypothetical protein
MARDQGHEIKTQDPVIDKALDCIYEREMQSAKGL